MRPLTINFYWGGRIVFYPGCGVSYDPPVPRSTIFIRRRLNYRELVDLIYAKTGLVRDAVTITVFYRYPEIVGSSKTYCPLKLEDDFGMETFFQAVDQLSSFVAELYVEIEAISQMREQLTQENQCSFTSLLNSFPERNVLLPSNCPTPAFTELNAPAMRIGQCSQPSVFEGDMYPFSGAATDFDGLRHDARLNLIREDDQIDDGFDIDDNGGNRSDDDDNGEPYSDDDGYREPSSDDDSDELDPESSDSDAASSATGSENEAEHDNMLNFGGMSFGGTSNDGRVLRFLHDIGDGNNPDPTDDKGVSGSPVYSVENRLIKRGMLFDSKVELKKAVSFWGQRVHNREHYVTESKANTWEAKCKSEDPCGWRVRAVRKCTHNMWQITRWGKKHTCVGAARSSGHVNLTSTVLAGEIRHLLEDNPLLPVKSIMQQVKETLGVNISYKKAWYARLKAIDLIYGTWEESFAKLPTYFQELKRSNPSTVVQWKHHPHREGTKRTFKYVFWAFHPPMEASYSCRPVISVDGTFLKGSYRGKLLVAVSHDANDYILPIAFAIVDEETTESWTWFMRQLRLFVVTDRIPTCVISDRHQGLINAMENLEEWQEPIAYHRFCLRHLKSNYAKNQSSNVHQKNLVWLIGSAKQKRKTKMHLKELKNINREGWVYLNKVSKEKWCLAYDDDARWGILTTNISESYNNVLRGVRHLPITALVNATLTRTVTIFAERSREANSCSEALPKRIWKKFKFSEKAAKGHHAQLFDSANLVYKVTTKLKPRLGKGGHTHTLKYNMKWCSCGKWQMFRRPCSHALTVCRQRCDNPLNLFSDVYSIKTFKAQYDIGFSPLRDESEWRSPTWSLLPDTDMFKRRRHGKLGERRIRNEMDQANPKKPRLCSLCGGTGHDRRTCSRR